MISKLKRLLYPILFKETVTFIKDEDTLNGKVVIITGASQGLGKAIAETLLHKGACLILISRTITTHNLFPSYDRDRLLLIDADITIESEVERAVKIARAKFGRIDVLINNAGRFSFKSIGETSQTDYNTVIDTNVKGVFLMSRAVVPTMIQQHGGLIINIGSKVSHNTNIRKNMTLYALSKYAVEGFSNALSKELRTFGIRVVCLMPGTLNTSLSLNAHNFMSAYDIGQIIDLIIRLDTVDFEGIVVKSIQQDI